MITIIAANPKLQFFSHGLLVATSGLFCLLVSFNGAAQEYFLFGSPTNAPVQNWNWHVQNTDIVQGDPGFPAKYSGPNSLNSEGEVQETVTLDLFAGVRLWRGAEAHMDCLMWQGFGLSPDVWHRGISQRRRLQSRHRNSQLHFARLFIRQTIGLGGEQEDVPDDQLTLAGKQDISRLTFTLGRFSPLDICDNNTYANDPHTQFMNWAMMGNLTWDYGQDTSRIHDRICRGIKSAEMGFALRIFPYAG